MECCWMDTVMSQILLQLLLLHTETWCAALRHIDDTCIKRRAGVCKVRKGQVPCITGMRLEQCSAPHHKIAALPVVNCLPSPPDLFSFGDQTERHLQNTHTHTHTQLSVVLPYARLETFCKIKVNVGQRHNRRVEKNKGKRDDGKGISTFFFQFFFYKKELQQPYLSHAFLFVSKILSEATGTV